MFLHRVFLLFLPKSSTCRSMTITCTAAFDIHVVRIALIIGIINTFCCLTVDTDRLAGMDHGAFKGIRSFFFLDKAFAAGIVTVAGMLSAHHNVPFAAKAILIIGTILHRTF